MLFADEGSHRACGPCEPGVCPGSPQPQCFLDRSKSPEKIEQALVRAGRRPILRRRYRSRFRKMGLPATLGEAARLRIRIDHRHTWSKRIRVFHELSTLSRRTMHWIYA